VIDDRWRLAGLLTADLPATLAGDLIAAIEADAPSPPMARTVR